MAGEYTWLDKVTRTRKPKAHKPCMCDDCNQPCNCEGCKALAEAQARIATLETQVTVLREALETVANVGDLPAVQVAAAALKETEGRVLSEECACSKGDTCMCAYDCDCRTRWQHIYIEDGEYEGWQNTGKAGGGTVSDYRIICPRECVSPKTEHCIGTVHEDAGGVRCDFCGRYMPLDEAIQFPEEA